MHTAKILKLIAERPGVRTVEIADLVDCDLDLVEPSIDSYLASGEVIRTEVLAPNGREMYSYRMGSAEPAKDVTLVAAPVAVPRSAPAGPVKAEPFAALTIDPAVAEKPKSKVQIAIDFIKAQSFQIATGAELHRVMGLKPHEHPSSYLVSALSDGRLLKEGKFWSIPKPEGQEPAPFEPTAVIEIEAEILAPLATPIDNEEFRCALWNTGELHLLVGAETVLRLTANQTGQVRDLLGRAA